MNKHAVRFMYGFLAPVCLVTFVYCAGYVMEHYPVAAKAVTVLAVLSLFGLISVCLGIDADEREARSRPPGEKPRK